MNYYLIDFDNFTTLVIKSDDSMGVVLRLLNEGRGLEYNQGHVHNPKLFKTIKKLEDPSDKYKLLARDLREVLL